MAVHGFDGSKPFVTYAERRRGSDDGLRFHRRLRRLSRRVPRQRAARAPSREYEKVYPFGWLGMLSDTPPVNDELIYVNSPRGFALCSHAQPTRSRYYLQVPLTEKVEELDGRCVLAGAAPAAGPPRAASSWSPGRRWRRASRRCAALSPSRMRFGRMFLAGDAGHIVPPTGAKGLNLAATDVKYLSGALDRVLPRQAARPASTLFRALPAPHLAGGALFVVVHHPDAPLPGRRPDRREMQQAELDYLLHSEAARRTIAENYVGLPLDFGD